MKPRSIIIYANSGEGKTSNLYQIAKYLKSTRPNKKVRLISADGGGFTPFQDDPEMIDSGFVEALDISGSTRPLSISRNLMQGYWPLEDGELSPTEKCVKGLKDVCAYLVEGTTSISSLWLNNMSSTAGGVGFKLGTNYTEDDYTFGTLSEGHYGIAQQELYKIIVHGFESLPVEYVIFTALLDQGKDAQKREVVYGPSAAGKALTGVLTSWFNDAFHIDNVTGKNAAGETTTAKVAWFINHPDKDTGINYLAKVSLIPEVAERFKQQYKNGFIQLTYKRGLDKYLEFLENQKAEMRKK